MLIDPFALLALYESCGYYSGYKVIPENVFIEEVLVYP
jgi:hypothetical protein